MATIVGLQKIFDEKMRFLKTLEDMGAITKAAARKAEVLTQIQERMRALPPVFNLPKQVTEQIRLALQALTELTKRREFFTKIDEDALWLLGFGWPPPMHAPLIGISRLRKYCNGMDQAETQTTIDENVLHFYNPRCLREELLLKWKSKPFLKKRIHILQSVIEAHLRSEFALSVPALLPQIDGIIAENFAHQGSLRWKEYIRYVEQVLPKDTNGFKGLYRQFIRDEVLAPFVHGQSIFSDLNRHAILHGVDTGYAKATTSLKAILVFDFLIDQIAFVSANHSKVYHHPECSKIRHSKGARCVYSSEIHALADTKRPCRVCCRESEYHNLQRPTSRRPSRR